MKAVDRLFCLVLALFCLVTPAFGTAISGDLTDELDSRQAEWTDGDVVTVRWAVEGRYDLLGETFGAQVALELWTTLAAGGYTSTEDMLARAAARFAGHEGEIALVYAADADRAFVHVGSDVKPDCDLSAVEGVLTDPKAGDFDRLMGAWRELWTALAGGADIYPTAVTVEGSDVTSAQVEETLAPLREVFSGPVTVYYGRGESAWMQAADLYGLRSRYEGDAILLCYEETSGAVALHVGTATGLKLKGADEVSTAFAQAGPEGFARGVEALAQNLHPMDEKSPWTIPLTAAAVALIALGELWWRRRHPRA